MVLLRHVQVTDWTDASSPGQLSVEITYKKRAAKCLPQDWKAANLISGGHFSKIQAYFCQDRNSPCSAFQLGLQNGARQHISLPNLHLSKHTARLISFWNLFFFSLSIEGHLLSSNLLFVAFVSCAFEFFFTGLFYIVEKKNVRDFFEKMWDFFWKNVGFFQTKGITSVLLALFESAHNWKWLAVFGTPLNSGTNSNNLFLCPQCRTICMISKTAAQLEGIGWKQTENKMPISWGWLHMQIDKENNDKNSVFRCQSRVFFKRQWTDFFLYFNGNKKRQVKMHNKNMLNIPSFFLW